MRAGHRGVPVIVLGVAAAVAAAAPKAMLPATAHQFGTVVRGTIVKHGFVLRNEGPAPLRVRDVRLTVPLQLRRMPATVAPGAEVVLHLQLDTATLEGPFDGQVLLSLDDPTRPEVALAVTGQVVAQLEVSPMPAFFVAAQRGEAKRAAVEIINHEAEPLAILGIDHPRGRFTTTLEPLETGRRYRLTLILDPQGPGGRKAETILVTTSSRSTPVLRIAANTYLRERVYTFPDAVDLGALRWDDVQRDPDLLRRAAQTLMVYQTGGTDFRIHVRTDVPALDVRSERGPAGDRHQLTLSLLPDALRVGPIAGAVVVETSDPDFPALKVPVSGLVIGE